MVSGALRPRYSWSLSSMPGFGFLTWGFQKIVGPELEANKVDIVFRGLKPFVGIRV